MGDQTDKPCQIILEGLVVVGAQPPVRQTANQGEVVGVPDPTANRAVGTGVDPVRPNPRHFPTRGSTQTSANDRWPVVVAVQTDVHTVLELPNPTRVGVRPGGFQGEQLGIRHAYNFGCHSDLILTVA